MKLNNKIELFLGRNMTNNEKIIYLNGDRNDSRIENMRLITRKEKEDYGSNNKIGPEVIKKIRILYWRGLNYSQISYIMGVSDMTCARHCKNINGGVRPSIHI